ncbi:sigma factor-like helix-turn-helix DNA-binding protein, partial [Streptomyces acidiscabies]|uniref:sigma factor-like helix-turn-helix DNA-binding protein n=1 Tax=Streptomyces acidiscabies TaxID=42234 RepID=UPI0038F7AA73
FVHKKMICEKIRECIDNLPTKHRDLMSYYLENGCTQREAAAHVGVSESSAFQIIKKSLTQIRKTLESQRVFEGAMPI